MKPIPAAFLCAALFLSLPYAQDVRPEPVYPNAWPQRNREPAARPEPLQLPQNTQIREENAYEAYDMQQGYPAETQPDLNTVDLNQFLIEPGPGMLPPMPPVLTNPSADILDFIRRNIAAMTNSNAQGLSTNAPVSKPPKFSAPYAGMVERIPPKAAVGVWWRFYAQNTSIFNIPAACEEMIVIADNGDAVWLQNIQTAGTVQSKSQRRLSISVYENFGGADTPLWVFYYPSKELARGGAKSVQKPSPRTITNTESVFNQPSYFVRIFPEQGFMQMSKNPNFPQDQTMYWRYSPRDIPEIIAPITNNMDEGAVKNNVPAEDGQPALEDALYNPEEYAAAEVQL